MLNKKLVPDTNWDPGVSLLKGLRAMSMPAFQRVYMWDGGTHFLYVKDIVWPTNAYLEQHEILLNPSEIVLDFQRKASV